MWTNMWPESHKKSPACKTMTSNLHKTPSGIFFDIFWHISIRLTFSNQLSVNKILNIESPLHDELSVNLNAKYKIISEQ